MAKKRRDLTEEEVNVKTECKRLWNIYRKKNDQTQDDLAAAMEFKGQSAVSNYVSVNNNTPPNTDFVLKFCRIIGEDPIKVWPSKFEGINSEFIDVRIVSKINYLHDRNKSVVENLVDSLLEAAG